MKDDSRRVGRTLGLLLALLVMLTAGCATSSYRQDVLRDLQVRAQKRQLQLAQEEVGQGRYPQAIDQLRRFLQAHPHSPFADEARWVLARAYQAAGDLPHALREYRSLAQGAPRRRYRQQASRALAELNANIEETGQESRDIRAVRVPVSRLAKVSEGEGTLDGVVPQGFNAVLIDGGCPTGDGSDGFRPRAFPTRAVSESAWSETLRRSIEGLHARPLSVFVGLDLRCLGNLDPKAAWRDRTYDPVTNTIRDSPYFDLFNPDYQDYVSEVLGEIADMGVEGFVFFSMAPFSIYDGFAPRVVQTFNQTFRVRLNPEAFEPVVAATLGSPSGRRDPAPPTTGMTVAHDVPDVWRWAGWKMRQRLRILERLADGLRDRRSTVRVGLHVHPESLDHPIQALIRSGEDMLEASRRGFEFFLLAFDWRSGRASGTGEGEGTAWLSTSERRLLERLLQVVEEPEQIWVMVPREDQSSSEWNRLNGTPSLPDGIGVVYWPGIVP